MSSDARPGLRFVVLIFALALGAYLVADATSAQTSPEKKFRPDLRRALASKTKAAKATHAAAPRAKGYLPARGGSVSTLDARPRANPARQSGSNNNGAAPEHRRAKPAAPVAHSVSRKSASAGDASVRASINSRIRPGT
ncbi:MAG: hypothetical protein LC747_08095, partial [Acidobacteria bacterium]|nr:hypothetical protein [Acidobacteriota bacterium]